MSYDRNPTYGKDQSFSEGARRVTELLWETSQGDLSAFPRSYLENLRHEYSDGNVSMLELIDRVDLGPDATYEDYCEVVESLLSVDPSMWPDPDAVLSVPANRLDFEISPEVQDFSEFDFADEIIEEEEVVVEEEPAGGGDDMSEKMELFFKKVIASVYLDGVSSVTDSEGNPPNSANNYLLSDDGKVFSGVFTDEGSGSQPKQFPFRIMEGKNGKWSISY